MAMSDLTFPDLDNAQPLMATSSTPTVPVTPTLVPDLGIKTPTVQVPNVLSPVQGATGGTYQSIPEWTYKRFQLTDIFYSKIGISAITSLLTFSILSVTNPPFVQESNENPIEISKPSLSVLYCISFVIFVMMMIIPVGK